MQTPSDSLSDSESLCENVLSARPLVGSTSTTAPATIYFRNRAAAAHRFAPHCRFHPETSQVNCTYSPPWHTRLPAPLYIFYCWGRRGSRRPPATPAPRPALVHPATTGTAAPGAPARTSRRIMVATAAAARVMVRTRRLKPQHAIDATHRPTQAVPKRRATTRSSTRTSVRRPATLPATPSSTTPPAPTTAATAARRRVKV